MRLVFYIYILTSFYIIKKIYTSISRQNLHHLSQDLFIACGSFEKHLGTSPEAHGHGHAIGLRSRFALCLFATCHQIDATCSGSCKGGVFRMVFCGRGVVDD